MAVPIVRIEIGDVVKLKKPHACGTNAWRVIKLGMDIGLECTGCGRHVRLVRHDFDRRFRGYISRASAPPSPPEAHLAGNGPESGTPAAPERAGEDG